MRGKSRNDLNYGTVLALLYAALGTLLYWWYVNSMNYLRAFVRIKKKKKGLYILGASA